MRENKKHERERKELAKYNLIPATWSAFSERYKGHHAPRELWEFTLGLKRRAWGDLAAITGTSEAAWAARERHGFLLARGTGLGVGESDPETRGCKVGGYPELGRAPWPQHGQTPLQFIAQLDLDELAELTPEGWSPLPEQGLLSFFADPLTGACEVLHQTDREAFALAPRDGFSDCDRLFPRPRFLLPQLSDASFFAALTEAQREALNNVYWECGFLQNDDHPVHSVNAIAACVNGYPRFPEHDEDVPQDHTLLLAVDTAAELGSVRFTLPEQSLMQGRWADVRMTSERKVAPDAARLHGELVRLGKDRVLDVWRKHDPSLPDDLLGDGSERAVVWRAVHRTFGEAASEALLSELIAGLEGAKP